MPSSDQPWSMRERMARPQEVGFPGQQRASSCVLTVACGFPDDSARQALCDKVKASALEPKPKPINTASASVRPPPPPSTVLSRQSPPVPNSQSSINSAASKKAVQHGKSVVLNSDSESDLEGYELDWGIPSTKMPVETRAQALANSPPSKSSLYLQQNRANRWKPPVTTNSSKAALSKLVEQAKRGAEMDRQVAEWKAMLEKPLETTVDAHAAIGQDLVVNIVGDDEEGGRSKRLLLAMQRTNATDTDGGFHFLKKVAKQPSRRSPSFPTSSLPNSGLRACFKGSLRDAVMLFPSLTWYRSLVCRTGFRDRLCSNHFQT